MENIIFCAVYVTLLILIQTVTLPFTALQLRFSIKDFLSKCDQIRSFPQNWPNLLKKSLMENFIFCAVVTMTVKFFG